MHRAAHSAIEPTPMTRFAAVFFEQAYRMKGHAAVNALAHVIDGQQGDLHSGQGLHFDTGLAGGFDQCLATDPSLIGVRVELDGHMSQLQRVAKWYQVRGFLGGHDGGDSSHGKYIALFMPAFQNHVQRIGLHFDIAFGDSGALGDGLFADIDHDRFTGGIKMWGMGRHNSVE